MEIRLNFAGNESVTTPRTSYFCVAKTEPTIRTVNVNVVVPTNAKFPRTRELHMICGVHNGTCKHASSIPDKVLRFL